MYKDVYTQNGFAIVTHMEIQGSFSYLSGFGN